ncbi:MAG: ATP synthase subunit I [Nitrosomonadales bacterium]
MRPEHIRLIWFQGVIIIMGAGFTYFIVAPPAAKSFVYGCCIAWLSTVFLAWRFRQGERQEGLDAGRTLRQAYRTAIERFAWTAIMLALGFGYLKLAPGWLLAGFVAGQAAWLLIPIWMKLRT